LRKPPRPSLRRSSLRKKTATRADRARELFTKLRQSGMGHDLAAQTAGSAHGLWRLANRPAMNHAFPITYFDSLGVPRLFAGS
jgi:RNA-directed DNA polymerase